jgi:hypothetical protein
MDGPCTLVSQAKLQLELLKNQLHQQQLTQVLVLESIGLHLMMGVLKSHLSLFKSKLKILFGKSNRLTVMLNQMTL